MAEGECRLWLAEKVDHHTIRLADGCHSTPEEVARALKLTKAIFGDRFPKDGAEYVMVEISDVPDLDPSINEDSAAACAEMVRSHQPEGHR